MKFDELGNNKEWRHHEEWLMADNYSVLFLFHKGSDATGFSNRLYIDNFYIVKC
jgi:hypothetical protein